MARKSIKELQNSQKAIMNIMEDLEEARIVIGIEKAKDDAMFRSIGEGLIAVDNERKITTLNKAAEDLLGWKRKELIGKVITTLPLEDEEGNLMPLEKRPAFMALTNGKATNVTYFFVKKNKTRFPIAINVTPIKFKRKTIGLIETIRDVTHEREIDKAKSEFVSLASHQLRTPLGITKWYLEALQKEDYFKNAPIIVKKYFDEIYKSNERILKLMRDLLSVSRIEQGKIKNNKETVDVIKIINQVTSEMQILANKKDIILFLSFKNKEIPPMNIDMLRLHEVICNLISNAIQYTKAKGLVDVIVKMKKKILFINIIDTGIGISHTDSKKLFTKFFRGIKAIEYNPEGSGLGLYVVKSYVEEWGGKITFESIEGKGSKFTVSLPI